MKVIGLAECGTVEAKSIGTAILIPTFTAMMTE